MAHRPRPRAPFHVLVKPVGPTCNLACAYCYYLPKAARFGPGPLLMSAATLEALVDDLFRSHPGPEVHLGWQGGEPTLAGLPFFRRAQELLDRRRPRGWSVVQSLQTNGTLLDDAWCAWLAESGVLVGLSVDGPAALHDRVRTARGGRGSHEAVVRAAQRLRDRGVSYNAVVVVGAHNATRPLEVYRWLRDGLGADWIQLIPLVERAESGGLSPSSVRAPQWGQFLCLVFDEWVRHDVGRTFVQLFEVALAAWSDQPGRLCTHDAECGRALVVEHDGSVFACDHYVDDEHRLGHLGRDSLAAMVASPRQLGFGRAKRTTLPAQCRACPVEFLCRGGCPKDRLDRAAGGELGLHSLCVGYRDFFERSGPAMATMAALLRAGRPASEIMHC